VIQVFPGGVLYGPMGPSALNRVIEEHLRGGTTVQTLVRTASTEPAP